VQALVAREAAVVKGALLITHSSAVGNNASAATAASAFSAISADSAAVVFSNVDATQFGTNPTAFTDAGNAATDLFWWDKNTGTQKLITHSSVSNTESAATAASTYRGMTSDSAAVVFSNANATQFGNNPTAFTDADTTITDLFWWDKTTGTQKLITHSSVAGNNASAATAASVFSGITTDSSAVVFSNVDATKFGNNGVAFTDAGTAATDLFWWDKATGEQKLISHSSLAGNTEAASTLNSATFGGISADSSAVVFGHFDVAVLGNSGVAFTRTAGTFLNLLWWDKTTGEQKLITHNSTAGNTASSLTSHSTFRNISADSSAVVFASADATKLGNSGTAFTDAGTAADDIFWWDKATGVQKLITHSSLAGNTESAATTASTFLRITADSSAVVFYNANATKFGNSGTAFTDTGTAATDLFWWDKATGIQKLITHSSLSNTDSAATANSAISGSAADSSAVVFSNVDATQFGNSGTAFTDAGAAATDLFWWDKTSGVQTLITHSSVAGNTDSAATANSAIGGIAADSSAVVFSNVDATQFGNSGTAFTDAGTAATDLFWWDKSTGTQKLITHSSVSNTDSVATTASSYRAITADSKAVVFSNVDATKFGNNGVAFTDSATGDADFFLWDAATGNIRLLTHSATDMYASAGVAFTYGGISADGNTLVLSTPNVSSTPGSTGSAMSDASNTTADLVAIRLSLLDLVTAYDTGSDVYDNRTTATNYDLNGYVKANQSVILKDNGTNAATATANADGVVSFSLTGVASGTHNYTLYDAGSLAQISLSSYDYASRAATLAVIVA
jgi:hypothetical protein